MDFTFSVFRQKAFTDVVRSSVYTHPKIQCILPQLTHETAVGLIGGGGVHVHQNFVIRFVKSHKSVWLWLGVKCVN